MIKDIEVENYMRNYALEQILEESRLEGPLYTSSDVWGNEVIKLRWEDGMPCDNVKYKLHTYKVYVTFSANSFDNFRDGLIENIADDVRQQNVKMFGGFDFLKLSFMEQREYTCNQLCEWCWLPNEDGSILTVGQGKTDKVYKGILIKYAVVTNKDNEEIDK